MSEGREVLPHVPFVSDDPREDGRTGGGEGNGGRTAIEKELFRSAADSAKMLLRVTRNELNAEKITGFHDSAIKGLKYDLKTALFLRICRPLLSRDIVFFFFFSRET